MIWGSGARSAYESAQSKRTQRDEAIKKFLATPFKFPEDTIKEADILHATASQIVSNIENGRWTASQVVETFIRRAAQAQAFTNCITEVLFDRALKEAVKLDEEFTRTKRLRGPLHGVPISVKASDTFDIQGYDTTIGFTQWIGISRDEDADLVRVMTAAGAIPICKTNVPQTMLTFECNNPLWGRTTNPVNSNFTCGGSSGGECALLALDGSVIGLGSDIGGSLRMPAHYCGVYSLKPTYGRVSSIGARDPVPGFESIKCVAGFMARSIPDLVLSNKVAFGVPGHDVSLAPVAYREYSRPEKLRLGYYTSDRFIKASPACQRAVLEVVEAMRNQGHECVEFEVPDATRAVAIFLALTSADRFDKLLSHLGPDKQEDALFMTVAVPRLPSLIRRGLAWLVETVLGDEIMARVVRASGLKPVRQIYEWTAERDDYERLFYEEVWNRGGYDAILAPAQALPQMPNGRSGDVTQLAGATILYNVVGSSVGIIPSTHVDPEKDKMTKEWFDAPDRGSGITEKQLYDGVPFLGRTPVYDPVACAGMPVGVQVIGKSWDDEKVLAIMQLIDDALKTRGFGPGSSLD
ncbi:amidase [Fistulina hepatica ATCC 64428]|nr:amidase [Fistulina hepatica ATCC 64428]